MTYTLPSEAQGILAIGISIFFIAIAGVPLLLQLIFLGTAVGLMEWGLRKLHKPSLLECARQVSLRLYNHN